MHCCGNPLHDGPLLLAMALPFLSAGALWLRMKLRATPSNKCSCGHEEPHEH